MKRINIKKIIISLSISVFYLCLFDFAQGETPYTLLEPLPGIGDITTGEVSGFGAYVSGAFKLAIGLATVLAVVQLSMGGFRYMTTEAFTRKSDAKKTITNAIFGLVLILSSFLLLRTINPDLVNQNLVIPPVGGRITTTTPASTTSDYFYYDITRDVVEGTPCAPGYVDNNGDRYVLVASDDASCYYNDIQDPTHSSGIGTPINTTNATGTEQVSTGACVSTITNSPVECGRSDLSYLEDYYRGFFGAENIQFRTSSDNTISGCREIGYTFSLFGYDADLGQCIYAR